LIGETDEVLIDPLGLEIFPPLVAGAIPLVVCGLVGVGDFYTSKWLISRSLTANFMRAEVKTSFLIFA